MVNINPWKCFVVGAIGTGIIVNVSFLILSLRKPSIPVDSHPYEEGLKYQENIDSEVEIQRRGWRVVVQSTPFSDATTEAGERRAVTFSITDATGNPVALSAVALRAVNPALPEADKEMLLVGNSSGEWIGNTPLTPGQWLLSWTFVVNQEKFTLKEKRML
jgi:nitrogen fixation protein FixH